MGSREHTAGSDSGARGAGCCPLYHEAVELVGRRWTGAILRVLMDGPLRFSEIAQAVPELSDRLLSERMKELERRGIVGGAGGEASVPGSAGQQQGAAVRRPRCVERAALGSRQAARLAAAAGEHPGAG